MIWRLMEEELPGETPSHVSLPQTMESMCWVFDCFAGECGDTIFFVRGARPLVECTFTLPHGTAHLRTSPGSGDDVSAWFKSIGVGFAYEGSGARLSGKKKVTIRSTQEDMDLCWAILGTADGTLWERVSGWYWSVRSALPSRFGKP
ncbi:MAG: hypothetical protein EOP84_35085 [Verrucomicrobiaceae bacterium]|nr:MAG: hypothetical protein EOP84_35085 [Verrucomicrobiaceae bacterium]